MARFFGTVQGNRGQATRLGHQNMDVTAQSYSGDICVHLRDEDGVDYAHIYARPHGGGAGTLLYNGPIADLINDKSSLLRRMAVKALEEECAA